MYTAFHIEDRELLQALVWSELKKLGIKESLCERIRKTTKPNVGNGSVLFGKPLSSLPVEDASLLVQAPLNEPNNFAGPAIVSGDIFVEVPSFLVQCCQFIFGDCEVEGVFRKAGSTSRQREIRKQLESGQQFGPDHHVVDVANIMKQFLRELPEPIVPFTLQKVFIKCLELDNPADSVAALNLLCLLLPVTSLATLCYLLQFFKSVAGKASENLMDMSNLSIVLAPSLMRLPPETNSKAADSSTCTRLQNHAKVIELLMQNNTRLCVLPPSIDSHFSLISLSSGDELEGRGRNPTRDPKRRRRTGSITRVFDGLKKMVGRKSGPPSAASSIEQLHNAAANQTAATSSQTGGGRLNLKRIAETDSSVQLAIKKKKTGDLSTGKVLATTPYTPGGQHFANAGEAQLAYSVTPSVELRPSPSNTPHSPEAKQGVLKFFQRKRGPAQKVEEGGAKYVKTPKVPKRRLSLSRKSIRKALQKREPVEETAGPNGGESKPTSEKPPSSEMGARESEAETNTVPPNEDVYEEMKQHYEAVKLSVEKEQQALEAVATPPSRDPATPVSDLVQVAYEKTLENWDRFSSAESDKLAKQLSRELRIRRSAEHRVIRSPSARKIGAIRRRSRDSPRSSLSMAGSPRRLTRSQSAVASRSVLVQLQQLQQQVPDSCIRSALRRGKPNSVRTGLRQPSPATPLRAARQASGETPVTSKKSPGSARTPVPSTVVPEETHTGLQTTETKTMPRGNSVSELAKNFQSGPVRPKSAGKVESSPSKCEWRDAALVLKQFSHLQTPLGGRPSLQKLREENSGRVSAFAKKFDRMAPSSSLSPAAPTAPPRSTPSPLKASQKVNRTPTSQTPVVKAPLLTPAPSCATPRVLKPRGQGKARRNSPMKVTAVPPRRSPRLKNFSP